MPPEQERMDRLRQRNWRLGLRIEILPVNFPVGTELTRDGCDQHCAAMRPVRNWRMRPGQVRSRLWGSTTHSAKQPPRSSIDDLKGFLINSPQFLSIKRSKAVNAFRTYIC
jgi:hypothetical protein